MTIRNLLDQVKVLAASDVELFAQQLPKEIDATQRASFAKTSMSSILSALDTGDKAEVLKSAIRAQPEAEQKKLIQQVGLSGLPPPNSKVRNWLWIIAVTAFVSVMVGSFGALAYAFINNTTTVGIVKPELILTMFSSVLGFLTGLFVPSPTQQNNGQNAG